MQNIIDSIIYVMYTRENFEYCWESCCGSYSEYSIYSIFTNPLKLASLHSSSRYTGLKHPKPTVLGPAIIVVIAAIFIINLITIISLNSPCLF